MNYTTLAGHLGADPETRFTSGGQKVTTLRLAARGRKGETIWWRVTIWGEQFDKLISYLKKGSSVIAMGEISKPEIYTDREGKQQVSMEITAHHLTFSPFGRGKGENEGGHAPQNSFAPAPNAFQEPDMMHSSFSHEGKNDFSDDEIPF